MSWFVDHFPSCPRPCSMLSLNPVLATATDSPNKQAGEEQDDAERPCLSTGLWLRRLLDICLRLAGEKVVRDRRGSSTSTRAPPVSDNFLSGKTKADV